MVLANEVKMTPGKRPNSAPASNVFNNEMGRASAVTTI